MTKYSGIQDILEAAIDRGNIGAHGAFWRGRTRDQFVAARVFGQRLIAVNPAGGFDPNNSALVRALEGRSPFGLDTGTADANYNRMPSGRPAVPETAIQTIRDWIGAGCPE